MASNPAPSIFDGFTSIMKNKLLARIRSGTKIEIFTSVNLYHENRGMEEICCNERSDRNAGKEGLFILSALLRGEPPFYLMSASEPKK